MGHLAESLKDNFVIANLGAGGDFDYNLSNELRASTILVEIDAADKSRGNADYYRREKLKAVVAGQAGLHKFRVNRYIACSSLHDPNPELVSRYELDNYYEMVQEETVECEILPSLLSELKIERVDFLKTDLEGEDFAVIKTMEPFLDTVLAIQAELRFEPFYDGEPYITEVIEYLKKFNFELVGLRPEYWKPMTPDSHKYDDGKIVWADCLFLKNLETAAERNIDFGLSVAKQIVILSMLGRKGYASYLESKFRDSLPESWHSEIFTLITPDKKAFIGRRVARLIVNKFRQALRPKNDEFDLKHLAKR